MGPLLSWWLLVVILGWMILPITFLTFRHLPDKGYGISKVLALLLLGYFTWIFGYFGFSQLTIYFSLLILLLLSGLFFSKTWNSILKFFKERLGYALVVEMLFFVGFLAAGAYKMRTHDIVGTEKPMDFAMINGILASPSMPPQDPWLSGGSISYYYFGYLIISVLSRVTGVFSGEGYNLGVILIWALAAVAAFSVAYNLTQRYRYSVFSAISVTVLGNLDYWHRAFQSAKLGDLRIGYYNFPPDPNAVTGLGGFFGFLFSPIQHYWDYFQASRIIPVPPTDKMINEFPSFSFFLSDLHPHVMAIPFGLLALSVCLNLMKAPLSNLGLFGARWTEQAPQWILVAIIFGSASFMNSWDFPMLLLLLGICLALQQRWAAPRPEAQWFKGLSLVGLPIVAACFILFAPFYARFQSQANGLGLAKDRTDLYYLCVIFGLFFLIIFPVLIARALQAFSAKEAKNKASKDVGLVCLVCGRENFGKKFCGHCGGELASVFNQEVVPIPFEAVRTFFLEGSEWLSAFSKWGKGWVFTLGLVLFLGLLNLGPVRLAVFGLCLIVFIFSMVSLSRKSENREMVFATLLIILAFGLIGFCEVLYIKDHFSGSSLYRMNTVFKFHYQAWIFLSIAAAPFLKWLIENQWPNWSVLKRVAWGGAFGLAFLGAGLYPFLTLSERLAGSSAASLTLDGTDYFSRTYPGDFQTVDWIRNNLKPMGNKLPVILEAWGGSYSEYARIATNTGYPTVLGWDFHEAQWRGAWDKAAVRGGDPTDTILNRRQDIDTIYSTADINQAKTLLLKYGVNYVYVGGLEQQKYKDHLDGLAKFGQLGNPVFVFGDSVLYKLNQ
jgi:YYY domain-containing protein